MRIIPKPVKRQDQIVGTADGVEFDGIADAVGYLAETECQGDRAAAENMLITLAARQLTTDRMNAVRMSVADSSPEAEAARLLRAIRKGEVPDRAAAVARLQEILARVTE